MSWFLVNMISTSLADENSKYKQKDFSIDEDYLLIRANSRRQLYRQIKKISEAMSFPCIFFNSETRKKINDGSFKEKEFEKCWEGDGPSNIKVLGVRKIFPLISKFSQKKGNEKFPFKDGDFVISSLYKVNSIEDVKKFMNGEIIKITYLKDSNINLLKSKNFSYLK